MDHEIRGADEARVAALARMLAASLVPGQSLLLDGPVGAGKTHFARAFIQARQGPAAEEVPSPTFTLVQTYDDPLGTEIWHADLYRLGDPGEIAELGLEEAMAGAICLIEWPDRLERLPEGAIWLRLSGRGETRDLRLSGGGAALARAVARAGFVWAEGWGAARVLPLAGDASARRYFRLVEGGRSAVLMDDPPPGSLAAYLAMTGWLREHGFAAPAVLAADAARGLLLIEDFGDDLVARVLTHAPAQAEVVYARIIDLLVALHREPPPEFVAPLDGPALAALTALFEEQYPGAAGRGIADRVAALHAALAGAAPPVLSLRDFHAENLVWRGDAPLGLLDFQDAVAAHPAYDLVSALQDARRDVDPALEAAMIERYLAATGAEPTAFRAVYALLGAQRALRILAVFTRLCLRDGKPRYLDFMPRVWGYLQRSLAHPALAPLAEALRGLPAPESAMLDDLRRRCPTR